MSIEKYIARNCPQIAVYWGNPKDDGFGSKTFDDPIEIKCRWEDKLQVITADNGVKYLSRAVVFLTQDVDIEGMLFLGTLDQLETLYGDSAQESSGVYFNPFDVDGICIVKRFEKTPGLRSTSVFLRKAFLTPWLT
jgi:hypothetical protein